MVGNLSRRCPYSVFSDESRGVGGWDVPVGKVHGIGIPTSVGKRSVGFWLDTGVGFGDQGGI